MKVSFVSVPSAGLFTFSLARRWNICGSLLNVIAALHKERPNDVFVCPSLQNYQVLHLMPEGSKDYSVWRERCKMLIARCDEVLVLPFNGWNESVGVADEILCAKNMNMPVLYDDPARAEYRHFHLSWKEPLSNDVLTQMQLHQIQENNR